MPEIRICHITNLIDDYCPVKPRQSADLLTVGQKAVVIQDQNRNIYQPPVRSPYKAFISSLISSSVTIPFALTF